MERRALRDPRAVGKIEKEDSEHVGYLMRWMWSPPAPKGDASLREAFLKLLWWNYSKGTRQEPLELVDFRKIMLPYEEWAMEDGSVVMLGRDGAPWLHWMADGTIACADPEWFETVHGDTTTDFDARPLEMTAKPRSGDSDHARSAAISSSTSRKCRSPPV